MKLYRVEPLITADYSDDDDFLSFTRRIRHHRLIVQAFDVVRETPKGKWIKEFVKERWISNTSNKRYAYSTVLEAYQGFVQRRKVQRRILQTQLDDCIACQQLAEEAIQKNEFAEPRPTHLY